MFGHDAVTVAAGEDEVAVLLAAFASFQSLLPLPLLPPP
jgi:hypothetical protein